MPRMMDDESPLAHWAHLCTTDVAALDPARTVAVLPVAATEQHGPHLPLSVDSDLLEGILARTRLPAEAPIYRLPSLPVGLSPEHAAFEGTLNLQASTALALWGDVAASVARSGVRKLVIFNTHGGHTGLMDVAAREWRLRHGLLVYSISWFNLPLRDLYGEDVMATVSPHEQRFGVHAGQVETAMMLALHPERVRMDRAATFESSSERRAQACPILGNGRSAKMAWAIQDYHPSGAVGDAAAATADLGHALLDAAAQALGQALLEVSSLPLGTVQSGPLDRPLGDSSAQTGMRDM